MTGGKKRETTDTDRVLPITNCIYLIVIVEMDDGLGLAQAGGEESSNYEKWLKNHN
jgi:hypothetical protein